MKDISFIANKAMLKQCTHIPISDLDIVDVINGSGCT